MNNGMIDFSDVGFVKCSETRRVVLHSLVNDIKTPYEIVKETDKSGPQISSALKQLTEKNIVICLNECDSKGRLYSLTNKGEKIISFLNGKVNEPNALFKVSDKKYNSKVRTRKIKGSIRQNVLMRDNYTCQICGATVKDGAKLEIDHIIPFSKGGNNNESNLQVLCRQCNREKHNRDDLLHDHLKLSELERGKL